MPVKRIDIRKQLFDSVNIRLSDGFYIKFTCEDCNSTCIVNLNEAKIANSYIHCSNCDAYYSLSFDVVNEYSHKDFNTTINLRPIIERIDKKELMDKLLITNNDDYIILETQQELL